MDHVKGKKKNRTCSRLDLHCWVQHVLGDHSCHAEQGMFLSDSLTEEAMIVDQQQPVKHRIVKVEGPKWAFMCQTMI